MATKGYKPFCAIYSTFLQRAFDQIVHDVCLQNLPVVFCMDRGGLSGDDGPTHHGLFDISYLRSVPKHHPHGPKDEDELRT
jgi:1-deoxy-D-xylulose-5-phosphate synthase